MTAWIFAMTHVLFWFRQPFQTTYLLPIGLFGVVSAVISITGALASKYTHALQQYVDDRKLLMSLGIIVMISMFCISRVHSLWALAFFLAARTGFGILKPLNSDLINRLTSSNIRATTL
jgi:hypothetical protein